jgi:integrase
MGDIVRRMRGDRFVGWYIRYKDAQGVRRQRASHQPTKEQARRFLLEVEGRVARGLVGIPEPAPPAPTVAALAERFLSEYSRPKIKDLNRYRAFARTALRRALPLLGELRADAVRPADLARLGALLAQRCAPNSARLTLSFLKTLFGWAVKTALIAHNPLRSLEMPARQDAVEYLTAAEAAALLATAAERAAIGGLTDRMLYACVHFAQHTGLRKGELLGLRWRDLDLATGRLTIARSFAAAPKSGKPRHLRLPDAVVPVLSKWQPQCPATPEGLVFPRRFHNGTWGMVRDASDMLGLPELLAAAGCRPIARAWHALRHTFASHYIMQGGNILALQKILGHSDIKMTLIYAHLAPDFLGTEMNRLKL